MTLECPKCKSPVARDGQRFCYRCGQELNAYYDSLRVTPSGDDDPLRNAESSPETPPATSPASPRMPAGTVVLEANAFDSPNEAPPETPPTASLKILLPTGDVFDRELTNAETQIGKGPRNDIVIADPAVSTAHAMVRLEGGGFTINDIGSRNGTFVNGERISDSRRLSQGDVIGIGLSKLTFRMGDYSDTTAIDRNELAAAAKRSGPPPLTEESLVLAVIGAGLVANADVDRVRNDGKGRRVYDALVEERLASEESLRDLLSKTFEIPTVNLNSVQIDEAVVAQIPAKLAREQKAFPLAKEGESLILAIADATNIEGVERLKREVRSPISLRLATATQIREQVDRHYGPKLIGVLPSGDKLEYLIDKHEVEVGKAAHNHIVLTDPTVSNTHAIIIARDAGYTIVDLGSRNGTFVNGDRLGAQAHTLMHGDKIQLGQTVLTFRNPAETSASMTAVLSGEALEEVRRRAGVQDSKRETGEDEKAPSLASGAPKTEPAEGSRVIAATATDPDAESVAAGDALEDDKSGKKKKKKKKKGGDERLRAAYISGLSRIVAQVMGVVLAVLLALYVNSMRSGGDKPVIETSSKGKAKVKLSLPGSGAPFEGGSFEASGVVSVRGSNGVLMVDDNRSGEVLWMALDESGRQVGPVKAIPLGVNVEDPEGITSGGGGYFYIIGSQSKQNGGDQNALVRFAFDPVTQSVQKAEALTGLRDFLLANVPELKGVPEKASEGGLNIEGIAWDPKRECWLLGLRSPLGKDESAFIVPIKLKSPAGAFSVENLQLAEATIPLKLAGLGVRDIQYDPESNSFLIISGAPEHQQKSEFILWEWSGAADQSDSSLRKEKDLDPKAKPEGITHVEIGGKKFILVVCDGSSYFKIDYGESQ